MDRRSDARRNDAVRGRVNAASKFVVYQNLIGPPARSYGLRKPEAFALIMKRCGYEALWKEDAELLTLRFRNLATGELATETFEAASRFGFGSDQDLMMSKVFEAGLKGWFATPSDLFAIRFNIAEQRLRGPTCTHG
jgi:hypothetical protein